MHMYRFMSSLFSIPARIGQSVPSALMGLYCALALSVFAPPHAAAEAPPGSGYHRDDIAQIDILPGWREADGSHMAAIRIRLGEGWKTYWRAPGDAGIPPSINWQGSRNLDTVEFYWPVPEVFDQNGMRSVGYTHELILPVRLTAKQPGKPISVKAQLSLGVCRDVCMPMQTRVKAALPTPGAPDPRITRAMDQRPDTGAEAGLGGVSCDISPTADGLEVIARLTLPRIGSEEVVVMETPDPSIWVSEADVSRQGNTLTARAELVPPPGTPMLLDRSALRFTVLGAGRGVDVVGCDS